MTALETLIEALKRLPGVGQKSAQRMAYHLLQHDRLAMPRLAEALHSAGERIKHRLYVADGAFGLRPRGAAPVRP